MFAICYFPVDRVDSDTTLVSWSVLSYEKRLSSALFICLIVKSLALIVNLKALRKCLYLSDGFSGDFSKFACIYIAVLALLLVEAAQFCLHIP